MSSNSNDVDSKKQARKASAIKKRNLAYYKYKKAYATYQRNKTAANKARVLSAKEKYDYWCITVSELSKKSKFERSDTYRKDFLKENPGILGGRYMCIYCHKLIPRERMQVDHLVAVNRLNKNPLWKLVFMWNKAGVNSIMNLYPACSVCNIRKKDQGGKWIARGQIGGVLWRVLQGSQKVLSKITHGKLFYLGLLAVGICIVLTVITSGTTTSSVMASIFKDIVKGLF